MNAGGVVGVFAKRPEPGRVKTRLAALHGPEWAARVAEACLLDTLDLALSATAGRVVLAFSPADAGDWFRHSVPARVELEAQCDGGLGERMAHFFERRFAEGARRVVLVGTDSPTLPRHFLTDALLALSRYDIVLGPCTDGGYYLVGLARPLPIFEGVEYSRPDVLLRTVELLPDSARLQVLPPWYDLDTPDNWHALRGHLAALRRAGRTSTCPRVDSLL